MINQQDINEEQNFWVSYADLMAGLLFVFILVLGAILIKYVSIKDNLSGTNDLVSNLKASLLESKNSFIDEQKLRKELEAKNSIIIIELEEMLLSHAKKTSELENKISEQKAAKEEQRVIITNLKDNIRNQNSSISSSKNEINKLTNIILVQKRKNKSLVDEFNTAKTKIKTLTGIRVKVIKELKRKLGKSIDIDNKSGAIRFYSNILFDQNKFKLKEKSKKVLSKTLKKYIETILYNKKIKKYINKIIIEGHTNTDGSYLHNLELSQKRALEVMKFLYSIENRNKKLLEKYVSASGRSYSDIIRLQNNKENKNASRRIEIKFQLKNEQSIKQLSRYFDKQK